MVQQQKLLSELYTMLLKGFYVPLHPPSKSLRRLNPRINNIWGFCMMHLAPHCLDRITDERIMSAPEYERFNIWRELGEVFSE